ncbi:hypothetical protein RRF57_011838 [Xylaria bambusicola]|uniref:Uncharacterized protein n=1 Tax=Xylaria bambusicola TaxID=326684 RepID=A0AAN7ZDC6_9PEZI
MLLSLVADILNHILPNARTVNPVQQAPGAVVSSSITGIVRRRPPRDTTHDDPRHDAVARH